MASARYISDMEDDESDQGAVQSAINKAMQVNFLTLAIFFLKSCAKHQF